jgi:hypothetical protein
LAESWGTPQNKEEEIPAITSWGLLQKHPSRVYYQRCRAGGSAMIRAYSNNQHRGRSEQIKADQTTSAKRPVQNKVQGIVEARRI